MRLLFFLLYCGPSKIPSWLVRISNVGDLLHVYGNMCPKIFIHNTDVCARVLVSFPEINESVRIGCEKKLLPAQ